MLVKREQDDARKAYDLRNVKFLDLWLSPGRSAVLRQLEGTLFSQCVQVHDYEQRCRKCVTVSDAIDLSI
jgi:hypothetical protein